MLDNLQKYYPEKDVEAQVKFMIGEVYSSKYCRETWYDLCYNTSPKDFFELKNIVDRNNALEYAANRDAETKAKADKAKPTK